LNQPEGKKIFRDPRALPATDYPVVAMGNFDGVHLGHQAILKTAIEHARRRNGLAFALTFDPPPAKVLFPNRAPRLIMTLEDKLDYLSRFDLAAIVVLEFTHELSLLEPRKFVADCLVEAIGVREVVIGATAAFGHRRSGNAQKMIELGREFGFETFVVQPVTVNGIMVSSSKIRELIASGDVKTAAFLLGRPHFLSGQVVRGHGRGRELGFPTANVSTSTECVPPNGVYAGRVILNDGVRDAVINIGTRPTFGENELAIEAYLFDFVGDIYGQKVKVEFIERVREERKFPSPQALSEQIAHDVARAKEILARAPIY